MDIPTQDDGLKWFGEGFDGFPKRLPDDCVEYTIHVIDAKLDSLAAIRSRLNQILKASSDLLKKHTKDYIWQREPFELKLHPQPSSKPETPAAPPQEAVRRPYLRGRTHFGDSIADEWLIVYLLLQLSKQFSDAWIRVYDTDGEFLLIEAASALPKWLNPEIAENRVWISNGHLRIIPIKEASPPRNLSLEDAMNFIENQPEKFIISPFIEDEAFYRLREYPSAISSSMHHALVSVPRNLAFVLHRNPAHISPAIEAFYLRDPVSVKPLTTKDISTLQFAPEDFVTTSVKFTKVGYAQLRSQVFDPPPAWTGVIPRVVEPRVEMGMKLTCGFEMLLADPNNQDKRSVREIKLVMEDVANGEETLLSDRDIASWPQTQDDEKWLDIDYNDFENELAGSKARSEGTDGKEAKPGKGFGDAGAQDNLRKMVSRFEEFLNDDNAGPDGVDEEDDDTDDDASTDSADLDSSGEDKDGSFSEADFEKAMKEMMGMPADHVEKSGLLEEARKLAVEDAEEGDDIDEDEEMKKVMELMEKELKGHGALNLNGKAVKSKAAKPTSSAVDDGKSTKPYFGPERPPNLQNALSKSAKSDDGESADEELDVGPGDVELSSDDEDYNDVDLGLAKNMLESFKGQAGMAGPAGNLMRNLGINMPRDEDGEEEEAGSSTGRKR